MSDMDASTVRAEDALDSDNKRGLLLSGKSPLLAIL